MSTGALLGRLVSGSGQGKHFTRLEWARRHSVEKLGLDPPPGTVSLIVDDPQSTDVCKRLRETPGVRIHNPNRGPQDRHARCSPVSIDGEIGRRRAARGECVARESPFARPCAKQCNPLR